MSLNHSFNTARKKIASLDANEHEVVMAICRDIQRAQQALTRQAAPLLASCMANCQGLCCRNIHPADIITEWDLVYLLAMAPQVEEAMAACLTSESFFSSDCIFLENGTGPCLFPEGLRPERCIVSFCRVEPSIEKEIGQVMAGFSRLIRFFMFRRLRRWSKWLPSVNRTRRRTNG